MFESYQDIFNRRGIYYHQAMVRYPLARKDEFLNVIKLADLQDNNLICDIPSGGCYLNNFIDKKVKIIAVETSINFIQDTHQLDNNDNIIFAENINSIPLPSQLVDRVISLAAVHHIENKLSFYQEIYRLLKPEGIFVLADALEGSPVAKFLNIFVDQYNSMGHQGVFLNQGTIDDLKSLSWEILYQGVIAYHWYFSSVADMLDYCKLLFGLDKVNEQQLEQGLQDYLGFFYDNKYYCLNWELFYIKAKKINCVIY